MAYQLQGGFSHTPHTKPRGHTTSLGTPCSRRQPHQSGCVGDGSSTGSHEIPQGVNQQNRVTGAGSQATRFSMRRALQPGAYTTSSSACLQRHSVLDEKKMPRVAAKGHTLPLCACAHQRQGTVGSRTTANSQLSAGEEHCMCAEIRSNGLRAVATPSLFERLAPARGTCAPRNFDNVRVPRTGSSPRDSFGLAPETHVFGLVAGISRRGSSTCSTHVIGVVVRSRNVTAKPRGNMAVTLVCRMAATRLRSEAPCGRALLLADLETCATS